MLDFKVVSAIFRKDMRVYLGNPTGYVFITLFIVVAQAVLILREEFFARGLADLATLNEWMSVILMIFVPALTMNAWADERRSGTDELLLTLPVRDGEVVLGKYLGILGMLTLSLLLTTIGQLSVLSVLGDPDKGLMFSTIAGYWLVGALFAAIGLMASMLTSNTTVAFILGVVGCLMLVLAGTLPWASGLVGVVLCTLVVMLVWYAARGTADWMGLVAAGSAALLGLLWLSRGIAMVTEQGEEAAAPSADGAVESSIGDRFSELFGSLSVTEHFTSFGEGVIRMGDVLYFAGGTALLLYLCAFLLGRRSW
ncbi:ABC transporter permease [Paraliomyxa miuraensis]|uniref:ABC transporter permease n=1 Tax=Paraliomyxa miuraensis TaxID=376150 RepID=UPI002257AC0D|nr:ABC transporter permease [Paraliomyxa miuraensis]MCX4245745.1 ABC transporter permease [Paraliomyxa miuraensis]